MTRALIVDDRQDNIYLLRTLLQARGWVVEDAADGADALAKARRARPDIVVADLLMPVMDGYTLLRHWQADEALRGVPVVVYTATYTAPEDEQLALDLGAAAFVVKPQEPDRLLALLDGVLANRPAMPAPAPAPANFSDDGRMRQYSEVLVRKLEQKMAQLEDANRRLESDLAARRRAEAMAEAARADLSHAFERVTDAFVALDRNWCYTYVNAKAGELLGRAPDSLLGKHIWTEFPEGVGQPFHSAYERAMAEQVPLHFESYYAPYGRWFENIIYPSPNGLSIYFHDTTARREAEQALRASEERLRLALDAAHMGTFDWDMPANRIVWSPGHEQLWGFLPGEFGGTYESFSGRVHPQDLAATNAEVGRCIAAREPFAREFRVVWPDGSVHWIQASGEFEFATDGAPLRMRGVVMEITARKQAEERLSKSETDLRLAQARANIGSWELDLADGTITCSDEMRRLIGRGDTAGPLPLADLAAVLHPADRWAVEPGGVWSLQEPRAGRQQVRVRHEDGAVTWIECRAETEFDEAGEPVRVSGTAQDVTERQFLMEQLADSNDQLRALAVRMDRLREEESSRLSRELHDELGQALAGLKLDLATLHTRLPAAEPGLAERVRSMQLQIDEMVRTTRDIARRLRPRVLDDLGVLPAIDALAAEICRRMGARYEIVSDVDNEALVDPALATTVFRVVQEALTNIARHAAATRVDIAVQRQSDWLTVEVRDNGKGMADPPPGRATLGLLGMQERAAAIGGQVTVEGFPGKGTVVTLRVPLPRQVEAV